MPRTKILRIGTTSIVYYVYILKCGDGSLYTGITIDVARRFEEHREGKGGNYTRAKGAERIVYTEAHPDRSAALQREAAIKKLSRREKESLIRKG